MKGRLLLTAAVSAPFLAISVSQAAVTSSFPALNQGTHTNWVENTVTNLIEIRMARNRFINELRTNWVDHVTTNVLDVYRTNFVHAYHTNLKQLTLTNQLAVNVVQTNFIDVYITNRHRVTVTNEIALDLVRTNVVDAFATNFQTLFLTNWQTVIVMKTNWITHLATNVVQLDLPRTVSVTQSASEKLVASPVHHTDTATTGASEDPVIEVSRTTKPAANGLVEVSLKIRWPADTTDAPRVQQWRIEREGGAFLSFGQEQECTKELPVGNYIVQARLQRDADSPSFVLKGTLTVTIREAVVRQRTDRSKLASVSDDRR